ncbi:MAG: hypothetical protein AMQ74_01885 [Candidatus Methanofastidiosum methylothiophilum]|uniref:Uncharacterized protein n=1 Tax=Candidatus Methanofastidiosum methylothiophilum TaxID=1705564 RepID=A0A150ILI6_9EURY|nr:MAG: hypothetical protein AMQ74_01885 [Candidatus Methanofastidiosum methylthiophilus]
MKKSKLFLPLFVIGILVTSGISLFIPNGGVEDQPQEQEQDYIWAYNNTQDLRGILFLSYSPNEKITEKYLITKADRKRWEIVSSKDSYWLETNDSIITILPEPLYLKESNTTMTVELYLKESNTTMTVEIMPLNPKLGDSKGKLGVQVKLTENNRSFENQFELEEVKIAGRYLDTTRSWNPFITIVPPKPEVIEG